MSHAPDSCTELLRAMVRVDTVTPHVSGRAEAERPLAEYLAQTAAAWGLDVRWLRVEGRAPNLLLTRRIDDAMPWVMLDSHLDTVGVGGMTIDPFGGELREGRVWGRGACDTKGTGAAMLWAAKQAIDGGELGANVAVLFTVGEEHAQVGARSFLENDLQALGWSPSAVIVGEPTGMKAIVASNGFLRCRATTRGRAAHSSTPERGRNAISDMARVIVAIEERHIAAIDSSHPLTGRGTCSINGITGGVQHNIIPDSCEVQIDQRLTPGQLATDALASIHSAIDVAAAERAGLEYEVHTIETAPGVASEVSQRLGEQVAYRLEAAGIASGVAGAPYTTNGNHYAAAGLPCAVLGPGDIAQAHTADEWIDVEHLEAGVRGYSELLANLFPAES